MNLNAVNLFVSAFLLMQVQWLDAEPENTNTSAFYPWSDTSALARVPKSFLDEVNIMSVTITNYERMDYVISDDFIETFALTDPQVGQLTTAINQAVAEWRIEKAKQLVPSDDPIDLGRMHPKIVEKFSFIWKPAEEKKSAILSKLKGQVLSILGKERSEWFWQYGGMLDNNEIHGFGPKTPLSEGMTRKSHDMFALQEGNGGLEISWYNCDVTTFRGSHGGGTGSGPYPAALDQYVPESIKPALARWRSMVSEQRQASGNPKPENPAAELPPAKVTVQAKSDAGTQDRTWQDDAPFVDLPKRLIGSFQIAGFTVDDEVSPEAKALFGVTDAEAKAVVGLYAEMRKRFEEVEVSHLERTKPTEYNFVLRAFPEQAKALRAEWIQKLGQIVGPNRAELLDAAIRAPIRPHFGKRGMQNHDDFMRKHEKAPSWLVRGMADTHIELTVDKGEDGKLIVTHIEWKTDGGESGSGGVRPGIGGMKKLPERWRHIITPEILAMPSVF